LGRGQLDGKIASKRVEGRHWYLKKSGGLAAKMGTKYWNEDGYVGRLRIEARQKKPQLKIPF